MIFGSDFRFLCTKKGTFRKTGKNKNQVNKNERKVERFQGNGVKRWWRVKKVVTKM